MKLLPAAAFLAAVLMLPGGALASSLCDLEYLPAYPSANSSSLLIIPTAAADSILANLSHPMKITWIVRDNDYRIIDEGAMQRFGTCWLSEFSGKFGNFYGTSGPTPFRGSGVYTVYFSARDFSNSVEFNRSVIIHEDILSAGVNVDSSGKVLMTVDTPTDTKEVFLTIYSASDGRLIQGYNSTKLRETSYPGRYLMEITDLPMDAYYASFNFRTNSGKTGGGVSRFELKTSEMELNVETAAASYWLGQDVEISGQTKYDQVSATVRLPNGRIESLGLKSASNQRYIYTFRLLSSYPEGTYTVAASSGGATASTTFSARKVLDVSPQSLAFLVVNRTTPIEKTVTITNTANETVTLSGSTEGVTSFVTLSFDRVSLSAGSSATLTVTLNPSSLTSGMTGKVLVTGNGIVSVPVDVSVTISDTGQPSSGQSIKVNPGFYESDDCLVGTKVSPSFTIQNTGTGQLGGFTSSLSSSIKDITDVTLPSSPIGEGSTATVRLDVTPDQERTSGWADIASDGGTATIYVSLKCSADISGSIDTLKEDVDALKAQFVEARYSETSIDTIFRGLEAEVDYSVTSFESGEYASAKSSYDKATAMLEALQGVPGTGSGPTPPVDTSWVGTLAIAVVVIVLLALGFFLYKKFGSKLMRKSEGGEEGEETLEEELY